jgi:dynein heavy chain
MNVFSQYLARLNQNIHIVLAMSPLGSAFSNRLRMFPSLVNCCTLDWFSEWPEEALVAVGRGQIRDFLCEHGLESLEEPILQTFKTVHKSVERISASYLSELRRHNYVTPMSYLELLTMFKLVSREKEEELKNSINRLRSGLDKLIGANREVTEMQIQLKELQPEL